MKGNFPQEKSCWICFAILDHKNLTGWKGGLGRSNLSKKWPKFGFGASRGPQMSEGPLKWTPNSPPNCPWIIWVHLRRTLWKEGLQAMTLSMFFLCLCLCICVCVFACVCLCLFLCLCLCERWGGLCEPRVWRRWLSERSQLLIVFQLFAQTSFYSLHLTLLHHPGVEEEEIYKMVLCLMSACQVFVWGHDILVLDHPRKPLKRLIRMSNRFESNKAS